MDAATAVVSGQHQVGEGTKRPDATNTRHELNNKVNRTHVRVLSSNSLAYVLYQQEGGCLLVFFAFVVDDERAAQGR